MHTNKPKVMCRRQIAVACAVFSFASLVGGCAGMMKQLAEELTDEKSSSSRFIQLLREWHATPK